MTEATFESSRLDDLPARLLPRTVKPGNDRYGELRHSHLKVGSPAAIVVAEDVADIQAAVAFAAERNADLAIRSGGHGSSTNAGGLVVDVAALRSVDVLDRSRRIVRVEAGARWGEVASTLARFGLAVSSGDSGDVGVGGLATSGGIGLVARRQGLTIDRIRAAGLVLADGSAIRADAETNPDLLWAVRGAGAAVGVVTSFELEAEELDAVLHTSIVYEYDDLARLLVGWAELVQRAKRDITSFLYVEAPPGEAAPVARVVVVDAGGDPRAAEAFAGLAPTREVATSLVPYHQLLTATRTPHTALRAGLVSRSGLLDDLREEVAAALADLFVEPGAYALQLRSVGGAVNDLDANATAYAHRHQSISVVVGAARDSRSALDAAWVAGVEPHVDGTYLNLETDWDEATVRRAFPDSTRARLRAVKQSYDPAGVFDSSLPIPL